MNKKQPSIEFNALFKLIVLALIFVVHDLTAENASTQNSILIPEAFNVKSVNGLLFSGNLFQNESRVFLKPGINRIALEYEVVFESDDDDFDIVKSNIFVIAFYAQAGNNYHLQYLKQATPNAARKYINNPQTNLRDQNNKPVKISQFFPHSQSIGFIHQATRQKLGKQSKIQLITQNNSNIDDNILNGDNNNDIQPNAEKMLFYWWKQANPKQRRAFLNKVKE